MGHLTDAQRKRVHDLITHAHQVADGLIPRDSPDDFTLPQPPNQHGLPWWFGPDYKPTTEQLVAAEQLNTHPSGPTTGTTDEVEPTTQTVLNF